MAVLTWFGLYSEFLSKSWGLVPRRLSSCLVTLAVFVFGITARGDWVMLVAHVVKQCGGIKHEPIYISKDSASCWENLSLKYLHLDGLPTMWLFSNIVGFLLYFAVGGFLHWHFYIKQRDQAFEWKCQPTKWLSPELQYDAILCGCRSLLAVNSVTSLMACYIVNGGRWSTVYYRLDEYTWLWYFVQWPVLFCYQDYSAYLMHRMYHTPWLYKRFHKSHHKYVQPTAFSVTAIHPVEIVSMQLVLCMPMFTVPIHWTAITGIGLYSYHNGIIDHSGIAFKAPWWQPWKPDTIFHDNHHQYFHVNFGFNCYFWDILHGTYRQTDRIYTEDIFYGKGKPLSEASNEELKEEIKERKAENINAHRLLNPLLDESILMKTNKML